MVVLGRAGYGSIAATTVCAVFAVVKSVPLRTGSNSTRHPCICDGFGVRIPRGEGFCEEYSPQVTGRLYRIALAKL